MGFCKHPERIDYKKWHIEFIPNAPFRFDAYGPSICYGSYMAKREVAEGTKMIRQPVFLTIQEAKVAAKSMNARASAMDWMLDCGLRCIKESVSRANSGKLEVPASKMPPGLAEYFKNGLSF